MSLKSFLGKFKGKKDDDMSDPPDLVRDETAVKTTTVIESAPDIPMSGDQECGVEIFVNNEKTKFYPITTDTRIGRDPAQTDISIPELIVSKAHCQIYFKGDDLHIKDIGSTNGTFVNGRQVDDHLLRDNDMITLGRKGTVRLIFYRRTPK